MLTALSLSFWTHSRKEEKTAATEPSSASSLADTAATSSRSGSAVCRVLAVLRLYSQSGHRICVCGMLIVACIHGYRQNLEAESGAFKVDPFLFFKVDYNINIHKQ